MRFREGMGMYFYGEKERELEERTGHDIEDFMDDDYFYERGRYREIENEEDGEEE